MTIQSDHFLLAPDPARTEKVLTRLEEIRLENDVQPDEAMRLAGKIQIYDGDHGWASGAGLLEALIPTGLPRSTVRALVGQLDRRH